jgi:hypothetical protein
MIPEPVAYAYGLAALLVVLELWGEAREKARRKALDDRPPTP